MNPLHQIKKKNYMIIRQRKGMVLASLIPDCSQPFSHCHYISLIQTSWLPCCQQLPITVLGHSSHKTTGLVLMQYITR